MSKLNEYAVLYVDDEAMSLKYFEKEFSKDFNVFTAANATDGWDIIQKEPGKIGVLMSDQRMPGQTGVQLLEKVRHQFPQVIRILVTAYSDIDSAVAGVNEGAIYRYISKPWDVADLRISLLRALEFYEVLKERDHLLREKLSVLHRIVVCDRNKNLAVLAAGLNSHFRHALRAARAFVAAIPQTPAKSGVEESIRGELGRNLEALLRRAGEEVFYMADVMQKVAEAPPFFSAEPAALSSLLNRVASTGPNPVSLRIDPALPRVKANQAQLEKLFGALATNIGRVTGDNPGVWIEARETSILNGKPSIKIQLSESGSEWTPEQRSLFFAPFGFSKPGPNQSGLDLAICYFIVHHHNGRLSVPGKAEARVTVELPVDPQTGEVEALESGPLTDLFHQELGFA